jgi:hypothetical protein
MRGVLKSKKFWIGAVAGMVAGPWALSTLRGVSGVGVRLPTVGNGG